MTLLIKDPEADTLARQLAAITGETLTETVLTALRERAERMQRKSGAAARKAKAEAILERLHALPLLDDRSPEAILGYDEHGLPT
ncbi:MAG: type II toxin-antitoxin system VapB family antitoxin [Myxococcota bacterium]